MPSLVCHVGFAKKVLAPPPEAEREPFSAVSFQAISGMYVIADEMVSVPPVVPVQYVVAAAFPPETVAAASPVNSVPPVPVTSGIAAGTSTARPCVADGSISGSQSAAPEAHDEAMIVWPWVLAW